MTFGKRSSVSAWINPWAHVYIYIYHTNSLAIGILYRPYQIRSLVHKLKRLKSLYWIPILENSTNFLYLQTFLVSIFTERSIVGISYVFSFFLLSKLYTCCLWILNYISDISRYIKTVYIGMYLVVTYIKMLISTAIFLLLLLSFFSFLFFIRQVCQLHISDMSWGNIYRTFQDLFIGLFKPIENIVNQGSGMTCILTLLHDIL